MISMVCITNFHAFTWCRCSPLLGAIAQAEAALAYFLRGLMELCIYPPRPLHAPSTVDQQRQESHQGDRQTMDDPGTDTGGSSSQAGQQNSNHEQQSHDSTPLSASCTDDAIMDIIRKRDPTQQGLPNLAAVRLLLSLLHWNTAQRPTAAQALRHAFFSLPLDSNLTSACNADKDMTGWC